MACSQYLRPRDIHVVEREGSGGDVVVVFTVAQESRTDRESVARSWKDQYRGPRCVDIPPRYRLDMRVLWLPLRWRRASYD